MQTDPLMSKARCAVLLSMLLAATAAAAEPGHPVTMWLVEGEQNRVYLLGSVHLLREQDHPLPAVIDSAYADAESLYMEIDMDDLDPFATQAAVNRLGLLADGVSLRDVMGEPRYSEAERRAAALDIPFELLSRSEPWYAAITVEQLALMRIGFNPAYGVEMHLTGKAVSDGKSIHGLETVEEQLQLLDGLPIDAQRDLLMQTLTDASEIQGLMDELIVAWRRGDVAFLEQVLLDDIGEFPQLYATIVADRNRRWVETIDGLIADDDDYLVIVGALHLIGADGVPALLEGRGYVVRQMHEEE